MAAPDRPLERRATARTAVVWDALEPVLQGESLDVVDIGGGTGGFAVRIAELGHRVTVVDPSPDALAAAARRADERGVLDWVAGRQGDLAELAGLIPPRSVDLVLCHGVLGLLDDPAAGLDAIRAVLRPAGTLSLVVSQRNAAVVTRAMAGHFTDALEVLRGGESQGERRFTAQQCRELVAGAGFSTTSVHGVRVFADLVPSGLLDLEPGAVQALLALEREVAGRPDFHTLAAQLHVLAVVRPD